MNRSLLHPSREPTYDTKAFVTPQQDEILLYCESALTLTYDLRRSTNVADVTVSFCSFFRSVTQTSVTGTLANIFVKLAEELSDELPFFQSTSWIDVLDDLHKNMHRVVGSTLGKKLLTVFNHVIAHTFYHKLGIQIDPKMYRKMEKGYMMVGIWDVATFADGLAGLLIFLMKAGRQAFLTGSVEPFFVDSVTVSDWIMTASRLRKDAEFLGNPTAVGINVPVYLKQISDAIDTGKKLAKVFGDTQRTLINSIILELELVQKRHLTTLCAASFRFCPIGVFVYGDSGVGKSFITKGLFYHYASVRGVEKEQATLYPRNPEETFMSGYKSDNLGILIDDVGKHKANKVMGIDNSLSEFIGIANNTPYITNQAELSDKGKIPMLVEWMGITSNLPDLGVHAYYNNTYAVLRRAEYRIEPIVKPHYRLPGTTRLDASKVPGGMYPDCWTFEVCRVMRNDSDPLHGNYQARGSGRTFNNYSELLVWLTDVYQKHIDQQVRLLETVNALKPETLCKCKLPQSLCNCERDNGIITDQPEPLHTHGQAASSKAAFMLKCVEIRRKLVAEYEDCTGLDKLYFQQWLKQTYDTRMVMDEDEDPYIEELADMLRDDMASFKLQPLREKLRRVDAKPMDDVASRGYLSFEPKLGGKRNFLRQQLKYVYDYVKKYTDVASWDDKRSGALEVFVYEQAPSMLAEGWDDASIYQAALEFVDRYAPEFEPSLAQEALIEPEELSIKERVLRYCGTLYFTKPWIFKSVNWFASTPLGARFVNHITGVNRTAIGVCTSLADAYDTKLKGKHPLVITIITICSSAVFITVFSIAWKFLRRSSKDERPDGQLCLEAIGIKPKVREAEKVNVWRVEERNITSLDFHPQRPNRLTQMLPALQHNSVYVETRSPGVGKARTRALIISNKQILLNSHACFENFTMVVYYGKKTSEGIQPSFCIDVEEEMIKRVPERDLAIITTNALPALFKDIRKFFFMNKDAESVGPAFYSIPMPDGTRRDVDVFGVQRLQFGGFVGDKGGINMKSLTGKVSEPTVSGDCGSPLIISTPYGPVVAGIHCAFNPATGHSFAAPIFFDDFDQSPMVQVGVVKPAVAVGQNANQKLYTDYHQNGALIVFGGLSGFRSRPKANGTHSPLGSYFLREGPKLGLHITDRLTTPDMGSWEPQQNILKEYLVPTHSMSEPLLALCVDSFAKHVTSNLTKEDIEDVHVVPLSVAVNGYPGVPNVDAQKFATAAGHGLPGPKKKYLAFDGPKGEWGRYREYDQAVYDEVEAIYKLAIQGIRSHPIFTAQLKDEMVSLMKKMLKKTRGFYMCPLAFLTVMRIFTTGLTRVMVRRRKLFRHAVGLNTHSEEWNDLHQSASKIPGDNWMAGDFKGFDKILNILLQNGAKDVILQICRYCGFTDQELLALDTLLCDNITAVIDFFGVLIMLLGGEVSGHQITTFFNSICNVLLHLYAWVYLAKENGFDPKKKVHEFWILVFICVLGDDIMAKVSPETPWYNHTTVQRVFAGIGIEYTMADKTSESVPYIPCEDVGFLKRRFASHEAFPDIVVAPLEKESIYKMMVYTVPSRSVSTEEQIAMALCSAVSEAFFHGRDFYNKIRKLIEEAPKEKELEERMLQYPPPSWNEMYERFLSSSPAYRATLADPANAETKPALEDSYCQFATPQAQCDWSVDPWGSTTMGRSPEAPFQERVRLLPKKLVKHCEHEPVRSVENHRLSKNFKQENNNNAPLPQNGQMTSVEVEKVISKLHNKQYKRNKKERWEARGQADVRPDTAGSVTTTQEIYQFKNEATSKSVNLSAKKSQVSAKMTMPQSLGSYFARPKLIHTFTWTEAMSYGIQSTINPWNLLLTDPSYKEKMGGFGLFRGNLHMKFTINGSPFYYGGLMAAYTPLSGYRTDTAAGLPNQALVCTSQKPHVWLNVQNTSSADLVVPFLAPYPFADTTAATYTALGKLDFVIYKSLQSANGVTGSAVDVQVFAWIDDIELTGPTNQPVSQSDVEYEQDRTVSSTASTVAAVSGALSGVPVIGPYAMATSEMAKTIGSAAELFGFTNVPNISDVNPIFPTPFSLASTQISTPITKLSLQPKQETALGASQHGGREEDELTMKSFLQRESFLVGSNWDTTDTPGTTLFTSHVTPQLWQSNGSTQMAFPPMGYLSQMFQYWRGSVEFTVKVIRSKYHRGRLLLAWDRNATNLNQGASLGNTNTFSTVLDLDEADEVTFSVPYIQARQFSWTYSVGPTASLLWNTTNAPSGALAPGNANGVFNVRVLNRLTAPEATSDVEILIFVRGGPDLEMAGPRNLRSPNPTLAIQLSPLTASVAQSDIQYEEEHIITRHQDPEVDPIVYKEVFGEQIVSLREFLHRSSLAKSYTMPTPADGILKFTVPLKRMPPSPGFFNNAVEATATPAGSFVNICPQHPIPWIASCYVGYKGSVNVAANVRLPGGAPNAGYVDHLTIDRVPDGRNLNQTSRKPNSSVLALAATANTAALANNQIRPGVSGKALTNTRTNTGISANLPYYANSAFLIADLMTTYNNTDVYSDANNDWWEISLQTPTLATMGQGGAVDVYYGTGPDFDCVFFLNTPIVYSAAYTL